MKEGNVTIERPQTWFEMTDLRRKRLNNSVWIPLRVSDYLLKEGEFGHLGFVEEFHGVGSLAISLDDREKAASLNWSTVGLKNENFSWVDDEGNYFPSDIYNSFDGDFIGVPLVLVQEGNSQEPYNWHLHQDFVLAMRLKREGDVWVAINEGYTEVAKLFYKGNGFPSKLEVRAEFLKDYLCARKMALFVTSFHQRSVIAESADHISWEGRASNEEPNLRWEGFVTEIHEGGMRYGEKVAVFHMTRTDINDDDDIPTMEAPPSDENTASDRWERAFSGDRLFRINGELWKDEWVEPARNSPRVRRDEYPASIYFITDEQGTRENKTTLEGGGKWVWFRPEVITALAHRRGGRLSWYTQDTGSVACSPDYGIHFGVNRLGFVNVYAKDIALLPEWQQQVWAGFNISPEGGISKELLDSQVRAEPPHTQAPEGALKEGFEYLNSQVEAKLGFLLFREHELTEELLDTSHRFRATDKSGFYSLAKDLARLTVERIDGASLKKFASPPKEQNWGSIKCLENLLATKINPDKAREITGILVGIYELRHGDSHLPGSDIDEALQLVKVDSSLPFVQQGH